MLDANATYFYMKIEQPLRVYREENKVDNRFFNVTLSIGLTIFNKHKASMTKNKQYKYDQ